MHNKIGQLYRQLLSHELLSSMYNNICYIEYCYVYLSFRMGAKDMPVLLNFEWVLLCKTCEE